MLKVFYLVVCGLKIGESTTYTAPSGKEIAVEILDVETYRGA